MYRSRMITWKIFDCVYNFDEKSCCATSASYQKWQFYIFTAVKSFYRTEYYFAQKFVYGHFRLA